MPRALEQIIQELNTVYNPQRDVYNKSLEALPGQQEAELKGLEAAKTDSFDQIVTGANRRGVAFGGIPLAEQAKYLGSTYLPAVANLKGRFEGNRNSLSLALAELAAKQRGDAQDIWNTEYNREEEQRRWEQQQAAAREAAARSASSGFGGFGGTTKGASTQSAGGGALGNVDPKLQSLYNQVFIKPDGTEWDNQSLVNDYNATLKSAQYGNARDKLKIELYHRARPDLFGASIPIAATANGGSVSF